MLSLPYSGKDLSMVVLLPRNITRFADLEKSLTASKVEGWVKKLHVQDIGLTLPRFKMEKGLQLSSELRALGMADAFDPAAADFSGMTGERELFLGNVFHKAFVEVNEEGTEAAGATVVEVMKSSDGPVVRPPPAFRANHPFVFLVRDNRNGAVLFLGRVVDPRK